MAEQLADIERLTENQAKEMALETLEIKGHNIYLVDLGTEHFGYSALVFAEGHHIHYADDYQLHHRYTAKEEGTQNLRKIYIDKMNSILFTDDELRTTSADYSENNRKEYYLRNYYSMRRDSVSCFGIFDTVEKEKAHEKAVKGKLFCPWGFCYYEKKDADFFDRYWHLWCDFKDAREKSENGFEYWKSAFLHEMYNHEYGINWQADLDVIGCFANVFHVRPSWDRGALMNEAKFTNEQRRAYEAARKQYYKEQEERETA